MVIFRENTEDIYAGIEVEAGTPRRKRLIAFLHDEMGGTIRARLGHRHQADLGDGHQAADPRRARTTPSTHERKSRDPGAQGQHPEVHRGRVPQLGL